MAAAEERHPWTENAVQADAAIMQSLAHPLRLRLLGLLRNQGPSTATKLAAQVGESSGLTSYHLRQLASAGLVEEAEPADLAGLPQTGGRERWWKSRYAATMRDLPADDDEAEMAAFEDYVRTIIAEGSADVQRWLSLSHQWSREWREATRFINYSLRLTIEEASELGTELAAVITKYRRNDPNKEPPPDAPIVLARLHLFPSPDQDPHTGPSE